MRRHLNKMLPILFIALSMLSFTACDGDLGKKLGNAGLNTLMGMGVVFLVLILISFVISAFGLINKAEERKKANVPAAPAPVPAAPAVSTTLPGSAWTSRIKASSSRTERNYINKVW